MSNFSDSFNRLQQNVYGGRDVSESIRKSPIELKDTSPLSTLEGDPFKFSSISYPRDVTLDMQNGHYMLFYINVQNKTKYIMESAAPNSKVGEVVSKPVSGAAGRVEYVDSFESYGEIEATYRANLVKKGITGNIIGSDTVHLAKGRKAMSGFSSVLPTTTRITDSIAIYLPPNVQETTSRRKYILAAKSIFFHLFETAKYAYERIPCVVFEYTAV